jgi:uncharacterized protein (DUF58 family)
VAFLRSIYLSNRLFAAVIFLVVLFVAGFFFAAVFAIAKAALIVVIVLVIIDFLLVFNPNAGVIATRAMADKLSNGDDNKVIISIVNKYNLGVNALIIDELPDQFQARDMKYKVYIPALGEKLLEYSLKPLKRGEYHFGFVNIYISSVLSLVQKRFKAAEPQMAPVYPSYIQMRKYQIMAMNDRLVDMGIKKMRRIGQTMEFDQVRDYVMGDDIRNINWKATARKDSLMVNQYQDEKAQNIYCIIDKGRVMKMPFDGLSLLDYAINSCLVMSNICLLKHDKPGLLTFSDKIGNFLPAERKALQMHTIMEVLYKQKTRYLESNFEMIAAFIRRKITNRSLLLFYTNFESLASLKRQLPYLQLMARNHLVTVIFFENTELKSLLANDVQSTEDIYIKTIAEKFAYEKRQIVKELAKYGIHSILTPPKDLTVNTINKYFEFKARGLI